MFHLYSLSFVLYDLKYWYKSKCRYIYMCLVTVSCLFIFTGGALSLLESGAARELGGGKKEGKEVRSGYFLCQFRNRTCREGRGLSQRGSQDRELHQPLWRFVSG